MTTIIKTIETTTPRKHAYLFGAILACDKGVGNKIEQRGESYLVVADDNRAVEFRAA